MQRREFMAGTGMLIGAVCAPRVSSCEDARGNYTRPGKAARHISPEAVSTAGDAALADDAAAVKQAIVSCYSTFFVDFDKKKYRSLLTDYYMLLENGQVLDVEGDIAMMPAPDSGYKRTDAFDFHSVKVHGDIAYAVYFLKSEMTDKKKGHRELEWLESSILRRSPTGWKMALLHSTWIVK